MSVERARAIINRPVCWVLGHDPVEVCGTFYCQQCGADVQHKRWRV